MMGGLTELTGIAGEAPRRRASNLSLMMRLPMELNTGDWPKTVEEDIDVTLSTVARQETQEIA